MQLAFPHVRCVWVVSQNKNKPGLCSDVTGQTICVWLAMCEQNGHCWNSSAYLIVILSLCTPPHLILHSLGSTHALEWATTVSQYLWSWHVEYLVLCSTWPILKACSFRWCIISWIRCVFASSSYMIHGFIIIISAVCLQNAQGLCQLFTVASCSADIYLTHIEWRC